jgi:hypothetical protein
MVMSADSFDLTMREGFDSISGPLSNSFCSIFEGTVFDFYNIAEHRAKYASRQMVTAVLREKTSLNICGFLKAMYKIKSLIGSFTVCQQYVEHMALSDFESHVLPSNTVDYVERRLSKLFPDSRATSFKRLGVIPFILTKREYQIRFILHDDKHNVESDHMIFPEDLAEYSKLERFNKYGLIGPNSVIRTNLTWGGEICPATRVLHPNSISRQYLGGNTSVRLEQSIVIYEEYWNIVNGPAPVLSGSIQTFISTATSSLRNSYGVQSHQNIGACSGLLMDHVWAATCYTSQQLIPRIALKWAPSQPSDI